MQIIACIAIAWAGMATYYGLIRFAADFVGFEEPLLRSSCNAIRHGVTWPWHFIEGLRHG